jgi:hypothetical protein
MLAMSREVLTLDAEAAAGDRGVLVSGVRAGSCETCMTVRSDAEIWP